MFVLIRAYDRAAIKFRGVDADINFTITDYDEEMKQVGSYIYIIVANCILSFL